jgi:hypothetical protein
MAVVAREAWTDERLDDLNGRVDRGFGEIRGEFQEIRRETKEELRGIREEIGALNRTIIQFAFALVAAVFLGFMGTIAALVTLV